MYITAKNKILFPKSKMSKLLKYTLVFHFKLYSFSSLIRESRKQIAAFQKKNFEYLNICFFNFLKTF